jgi:hypothetical protein
MERSNWYLSRALRETWKSKEVAGCELRVANRLTIPPLRFILEKQTLKKVSVGALTYLILFMIFYFLVA